MSQDIPDAGGAQFHAPAHVKASVGHHCCGHRGQAGKITLRHAGRLYSIGIGRTHTRTRVIVLARDLDIRVINAATGELLRELTLDPAKRYQPIRPTPPRNDNG